MALSDITLLQAWNRVRRDLRLNQDSPAYATRIRDCNEAVRMIAGLFYDLMASFYERTTTLVPSTVGAYYSSGASWDADTNRLTVTMNRDFASSDVGCLVMFVDTSGPAIYLGLVSAFVSTTVVELSGDNLPTSDIGTIQYVLLAKTSITGSTADLSSLDMMRAGQQIRLKLKTSLTTSTSAVRTKAATIEEVDTFRSAANQNKNLLLFALSGNALYFGAGSSISSNLGTLTLRYPGMPVDVTSNTSELDIPKGTPYELVIMQWEKVLRRRFGMPEPDLTKEIQTHIQNLYNTFQAEIGAEAVKEKIDRLK